MSGIGVVVVRPAGATVGDGSADDGDGGWPVIVVDSGNIAAVDRITGARVDVCSLVGTTVRVDDLTIVWNPLTDDVREPNASVLEPEGTVSKMPESPLKTYQLCSVPHHQPLNFQQHICGDNDNCVI